MSVNNFVLFVTMVMRLHAFPRMADCLFSEASASDSTQPYLGMNTCLWLGQGRSNQSLISMMHGRKRVTVLLLDDPFSIARWLYTRPKSQ
ncbi:hypothetical protein QL093DRAFT_2467815 [Fusarium oxysporum]|nr:hypothetical protein QL093DRAFT_2467815 [Fusarium oxysporum]